MSRRLSVAAVVVALAAASAMWVGASVAAPFVDGAWVNGTVHDLSTGPPAGGAKHPIPLYVISPISAAHALHPLVQAKPLGFGAHDHVAALRNPKATFKGACELTLVVPGTRAKPGSNVVARKTLTPAGVKPLLERARLAGVMTPLNWVSRIRQAQALGLAKLVDTHTTISCTIAPRR